MMILKNTVKWPFYWPGWLRNAGLLIIGIQMGTSFTSEALTFMVLYLPIMLVITFLVVLFSMLTAWGLSKSTNYRFSTALLGSFPGGLSQMVLLSEEVKGADQSAVALMQTIRILLVITVVPLLVTYFFPRDTNGFLQVIQTPILEIPLFYLFLLASGIIFLLFIIRKIQMPIPYMLAPLISVLVFNVLTGNPFHLPVALVASAQITLGAHLGLQMKGMRALLSARSIALVVISNLALIAFCIALSYGLNRFFSFPLLDMFLSAAPGGVAEMAITAYAVGADASTVTSFHLFRIFFILFLAAPLTVYLLKKRLQTSPEL
ncbi:hypothetical protein KP78_35390 [Jeotgalibacillus soli]|uniref:AbrB family transcriptional regulator n=2 Tax=Jeotgalibacillus soli TaxID=889306 RepID=A0A0C2R2U8_9BACL|nr:hypothetical protein KP78_35390 [Jeotgalibacillus soli]